MGLKNKDERSRLCAEVKSTGVRQRYSDACHMSSFKFGVDNCFFMDFYRYVCERTFRESSLACLATNTKVYLYLTFLLTSEQSVGDIQTVARILLGEGDPSKNTGMPVFWQMQTFTEGPLTVFFFFFLKKFS